MTGKVLSEENLLGLEDICEQCGLTEETVRVYVEEGVIEASGGDARRWKFSEVSVVRVQKAQRLERDLGVNPAGAALALELMAKIEALEKRLERLQPDMEED